MFVYRRSTVYDDGPALHQRWFSVLCLLGCINVIDGNTTFTQRCVHNWVQTGDLYSCWVSITVASPPVHVTSTWNNIIIIYAQHTADPADVILPVNKKVSAQIWRYFVWPAWNSSRAWHPTWTQHSGRLYFKSYRTPGTILYIFFVTVGICKAVSDIMYT